MNLKNSNRHETTIPMFGKVNWCGKTKNLEKIEKNKINVVERELPHTEQKNSLKINWGTVYPKQSNTNTQDEHTERD